MLCEHLSPTIAALCNFALKFSLLHQSWFHVPIKLCSCLFINTGSIIDQVVPLEKKTIFHIQEGSLEKLQDFDFCNLKKLSNIFLYERNFHFIWIINPKNVRFCAETKIDFSGCMVNPRFCKRVTVSLTFFKHDCFTLQVTVVYLW